MSKNESLYSDIKRTQQREIYRKLKMQKMRLELQADLLNFPVYDMVLAQPSKLVLAGSGQGCNAPTSLVLSGN